MNTALTQDLVDQLFRDHRQMLVAFLFNRVHCPDTALDLTQEVFFRLLRKMTLEHSDSLPSYLLRTAERLAIDHIRQQAQPKNSALPLDDNIVCPQLLPDELAELREQCERLLETIASIPSKYRTVFLLRKIDEMTYSEIAAHLGISEKSVQRYLTKAMLHCHQHLLEFS
ncbi:MAG: sigma-70 family RNA polymerase sigma factor [Methylococcaceae bacterium]|nr:sigma-70 family RNA polymerase sigma factor [Methylococcaceae bacterium]